MSRIAKDGAFGLPAVCSINKQTLFPAFPYQPLYRLLIQRKEGYHPVHGYDIAKANMNQFRSHSILLCPV
jgi:hypothetical protein